VSDTKEPSAFDLRFQLLGCLGLLRSYKPDDPEWNELREQCVKDTEKLLGVPHE